MNGETVRGTWARRGWEPLGWLVCGKVRETVVELTVVVHRVFCDWSSPMS